MKYTVIVILDTEILPSLLKSKLVSWLESEPRYSTTVNSVVVLMDGEEVAVYDREEEQNGNPSE